MPSCGVAEHLPPDWGAVGTGCHLCPRPPAVGGSETVGRWLSRSSRREDNKIPREVVVACPAWARVLSSSSESGNSCHHARDRRQRQRHAWQRRADRNVRPDIAGVAVRDALPLLTVWNSRLARLTGQGALDRQQEVAIGPVQQQRIAGL